MPIVTALTSVWIMGDRKQIVAFPPNVQTIRGSERKRGVLMGIEEGGMIRVNVIRALPVCSGEGPLKLRVQKRRENVVTFR